MVAFALCFVWLKRNKLVIVFLLFSLNVLTRISTTLNKRPPSRSQNEISAQGAYSNKYVICTGGCQIDCKSVIPLSLFNSSSSGMRSAGNYAGAMN